MSQGCPGSDGILNMLHVGFDQGPPGHVRPVENQDTFWRPNFPFYSLSLQQEMFSQAMVSLLVILDQPALLIQVGYHMDSHFTPVYLARADSMLVELPESLYQLCKDQK